MENLPPSQSGSCPEAQPLLKTSSGGEFTATRGRQAVKKSFHVSILHLLPCSFSPGLDDTLLYSQEPATERSKRWFCSAFRQASARGGRQSSQARRRVKGASDRMTAGSGFLSAPITTGATQLQAEAPRQVPSAAEEAEIPWSSPMLRAQRSDSLSALQGAAFPEMSRGPFLMLARLQPTCHSRSQLRPLGHVSSSRLPN